MLIGTCPVIVFSGHVKDLLDKSLILELTEKSIPVLVD
jgi:hypothetical protein